MIGHASARYGCHMTTPVDDLYCKPAFNISNGDDSFEACCILTYILYLKYSKRISSEDTKVQSIEGSICTMYI